MSVIVAITLLPLAVAFIPMAAILKRVIFRPSSPNDQFSEDKYCCCICGQEFLYHPIFYETCPKCGAFLWCSWREEDEEIILDILPTQRVPLPEEVEAVASNWVSACLKADLSELDLLELNATNNNRVSMLLLLGERVKVYGGLIKLCGLSPLAVESLRCVINFINRDSVSLEAAKELDESLP